MNKDKKTLLIGGSGNLGLSIIKSKLVSSSRVEKGISWIPRSLKGARNTLNTLFTGSTKAALYSLPSMWIESTSTSLTANGKSKNTGIVNWPGLSGSSILPG